MNLGLSAMRRIFTQPGLAENYIYELTHCVFARSLDFIHVTRTLHEPVSSEPARRVNPDLETGYPACKTVSWCKRLRAGVYL